MKNLILIITITIASLTVNAQDFWQQIGQDIYGENNDEGCGRYVSVNGDGTIIAVLSNISASGELTNYVKVYKNISGVWTQLGQGITGHSGNYIKINEAGDALIFTTWNNSYNLMFLEIYKFDSGSWTEITNAGIDNDGSVVMNEDATVYGASTLSNDYIWIRNDTVNTSINIDSLNISHPTMRISGDGNILVIGDKSYNDTGIVKVFEYNSGIWTQIGQDLIGDAVYDKFGSSVDINYDGSIITCGATENNGNGSNSGQVKVFDYISGNWVQRGADIYGDANTKFGGNVSISNDGNTLEANSYINDIYARIYNYISGDWVLNTQYQTDMPMISSLSGNGNVVIIGDRYNDEYGENTGLVRTYSLCGTTSNISETKCESYTTPSGAILTNSGIYYDTIPNAAGCDSIITINLTILKPYNQQLCLVNVDPIIGKNKLIWENNNNEDIEMFLIKKAISSNVYSTIASIDVNDPYEYIDYGSDPMAHSDMYKIIVIDTCGNQSDIDSSAYHKTINLILSNVGSTMSLNWEQYEVEDGSFVPPLYYIYRGTTPDNLQLIDSVTGSIHSYNDLNISQVYYYMIGTKRDNCGSTKSINSTYEIFSNKKDNIDLISVPELDVSNQINIYPNPAHNQLTITNEKLIIESIEITDITGKIIKQLKINNLELKIKIEDFENGVYLIKIKTAEASFVKQFVKE